MFDSRYGDDGVFVQIDFSQIELRVLAALSGDPTMVGVYVNNGDIHTTNACMIFGLTEEEMKSKSKDEQKRMRTVAKRVGFGICYGIGGPGIQSTLKSDGVVVDEDTAKEYLDNFLAKYPKVAKWIDKVHSNTEEAAYALSAFGRRRRLDAVRSGINDVKARALRQGGNHVVQSTAGDMTNTALVLFNQEVRLRRGEDPRMVLPTVDTREFPVDPRWERVHPILQVHDMIGLDCHKDIAGEAMERLHWTMENVVDLAPLVWGDEIIVGLKKLKRVPIVAEPEVGPNWRDAYKVKTAADVDKAMFVSREKRAALDADINFKWTGDHEAAALAKYESLKAA
jgi:DNA polymerase I-like protein with 3'-5' exonuclease and polymerase domains